jgi:hypothetical protein
LLRVLGFSLSMTKGERRDKGARAARVASTARSSKQAASLKAAKTMEKKIELCARLRVLAMPLDHGKITPEQAYTLGIASPGLVPDVSYLLFSPSFGFRLLHCCECATLMLL